MGATPTFVGYFMPTKTEEWVTSLEWCTPAGRGSEKRLLLVIN
jgi:hypothetical protein